MGFMGTGKSAEDKALEKLATYLENMDLRPKDGMVHAGAFEMAGGYSRKNTSRISVSYTHLDVYKRQPRSFPRAATAVCPIGVQSSAPSFIIATW